MRRRSAGSDLHFLSIPYAALGESQPHRRRTDVSPPLRERQSGRVAPQREGSRCPPARRRSAIPAGRDDAQGGVFRPPALEVCPVTFRSMPRIHSYETCSAFPGDRQDCSKFEHTCLTTRNRVNKKPHTNGRPHSMSVRIQRLLSSPAVNCGSHHQEEVAIARSHGLEVSSTRMDRKLSIERTTVPNRYR